MIFLFPPLDNFVLAWRSHLDFCRPSFLEIQEADTGKTCWSNVQMEQLTFWATPIVRQHTVQAHFPHFPGLKNPQGSFLIKKGGV